MRIFVDTNVLLDVLQNRKPHVNASSIVWKACECGELEGVVSALTFPNIVYVLRKNLTPQRVRLQRLRLAPEPSAARHRRAFSGSRQALSLQRGL